MDFTSKYKIIFFLSSVLVITTIIGEFARIESLKEGMDFGGLIMMFIKLIICFGLFVSMILQIIMWFLQCAIMWLPLFIVWLLEFAICAFTKLMNIPNCFLWYGLEIAGKILYLPFRLTFFVLDLIFQTMGISFSIQGIMDKVWWFIDDIDHALFDSGSGFHIVHYPEEINDRCYRCTIPDFPPLPYFFPMPAINQFTQCVG
jgi:hypothetical protein